MTRHRSIAFTVLAFLAMAAGANASQPAKPTPRPATETFSSWEEMRTAKGWPSVEAAAKLAPQKRLEIASAALTSRNRNVRNLDYGFALLLTGTPTKDTTRLLAKAILMNEYTFGPKAPSVLSLLAAESMRGCKSCVAAYAEIQYSGDGIPQNDEVAFKWYRWAAIVGNSKGIEATAIALTEGRGTPKDFKEAMNWAERLDAPRRAKLYVALAKSVAGSGTLEDLATSADLLVRSIKLNPADARRPIKQLLASGYPADVRSKAISALRAAGDKADPVALLTIAQSLWNAGSTGEAIPIFEELVSNGDAAAADYLVQALGRSDVAQQEKDRIIDTLRKAADAGQPSAARALGNAYYYGTGVPQSVVKARAFREQAAKRNDAEAQYLLGMMILDAGAADEAGIGRQWLERSASSGYTLARAAIMKMNSN